MSIISELIVIAVMLVFNGFFVAYEMALATIAQARLVVLTGKKVVGAKDALFMKNNIEGSFAVVQLGITVTTAIAAATGGLGVSDQMAPWFVQRFHLHLGWAEILAVVLWVIPFSGITIIFSELFPKLLALNNRERVCLALSPFMKSLYHIFTPVVHFFERAVKLLLRLFFKKVNVSGSDTHGLHELQAAAALARTSSLIGAFQEKIVLSAALLSSRPVKEIIIPIADACMIASKATLSEALIRAHMDMHTRFPIYSREGDPQSIEGYVNFKDIIAALRLNPSDPSVKGIVRPIRSVFADVSIAHTLEKMMQENLHIMLVSLKNGRIIGLVTLEDIIEEMVGEIEDEFDRLPAHVHPYAGGWIVGGGVLVTTLAQTTGLPFVAADPNERLFGWCARHAVGEIQGGQEIVVEGIKVSLRKFRRKKVSEVAVARAE